MDILDGLRAFVATAQAGSFVGGAERLGMSNRLVSKYIAELEDRLGVRLLQRTTRTVGLTSAGSELLARAPAVLDDFSDMLDSLSERSDQLTGQIRITAPVTFGALYLTGMISRFGNLHSGLSIEVQLNDAYVDLAAGGIDVAFRIGTADLQTQKVRRLGLIKTCAVASPSYLSSRGQPAHPSDLSRHDCIIDTNRRAPRRWSFTRAGAEETVDIDGRMTVNSAQLARDLAINGFGIALCPRFIVNDAISSGLLDVVLDDYVSGGFGLSLIYLEGRRVPRKVRALIDFASQDLVRSGVF